MLDIYEARRFLQEAAYAEWADSINYAVYIRSYTLVNDAQRRLRQALYGIEDWLRAVYDKGASPQEADYEFLRGEDRTRGLGYKTPSEVLATQEVAR